MTVVSSSRRDESDIALSTGKPLTSLSNFSVRDGCCPGACLKFSYLKLSLKNESIIHIPSQCIETSLVAMKNTMTKAHDMLK